MDTGKPNAEAMKEILKRWLHLPSVQNEIRAYLRTLLVRALQGSPIGLQPLPAATPVTHCTAMLVAEWLRLQQCHYTLSVLCSEMPAVATLPFCTMRKPMRKFTEMEIKEILMALGFNEISDLCNDYVNSTNDSLLGTIIKTHSFQTTIEKIEEDSNNPVNDFDKGLTDILTSVNIPKHHLKTITIKINKLIKSAIDQSYIHTIESAINERWHDLNDKVNELQKEIERKDEHEDIMEMFTELQKQNAALSEKLTSMQVREALLDEWEKQKSELQRKYETAEENMTHLRRKLRAAELQMVKLQVANSAEKSSPTKKIRTISNSSHSEKRGSHKKDVSTRTKTHVQSTSPALQPLTSIAVQASPTAAAKTQTHWMHHRPMTVTHKELEIGSGEKLSYSSETTSSSSLDEFQNAKRAIATAKARLKDIREESRVEETRIQARRRRLMSTSSSDDEKSESCTPGLLRHAQLTFPNRREGFEQILPHRSLKNRVEGDGDVPSKVSQFQTIATKDKATGNETSAESARTRIKDMLEALHPRMDSLLNKSPPSSFIQTTNNQMMAGPLKQQDDFYTLRIPPTSFLKARPPLKREPIATISPDPALSTPLQTTPFYVKPETMTKNDGRELQTTKTYESSDTSKDGDKLSGGEKPPSAL